MKNKILAAVLGSNGRAVTWLSGLVVSLIAIAVARMGWTLSHESAQELTLILTPMIAAVIEGWASGINSRGVMKLQATLDAIPHTPALPVDGVAGPLTNHAAAVALGAAKTLDSLKPA